MKWLWTKIGRLVFWLAWPLLYVYLLHSERTRVVVRSGQNIVVVKDWLGDGSWGLPGGGLHRHEPPPEGAVRELGEETGLQIKTSQLRHLGIISTNSRSIPVKLHCFCVSLTQETPLAPQRGEILATSWRPLRVVLDQNISADVRRILSLLGSS